MIFIYVGMIKIRSGQDMEKIYKYAGTITGLLLCLIFSVLVWTIDIDLFESFISFLEKYEDYEIDELIFIIFFVLVGVLVDLMRHRQKINHEAEIQRENLDTLKAAMRNVFDVTGNFFNNLTLFRMEIEKTGTLEKESIDELENLMYTAVERLEKIAGLEKIVKKKLVDNIYILDVEKNEKN